MRDYLVLYYDKGVLQVEHFPNLYGAQLWQARHSGWIVKVVETYEKESK